MLYDKLNSGICIDSILISVPREISYDTAGMGYRFINSKLKYNSPIISNINPSTKLY